MHDGVFNVSPRKPKSLLSQKQTYVDKIMNIRHGTVIFWISGTNIEKCDMGSYESLLNNCVCAYDEKSNTIIKGQVFLIDSIVKFI